MWNDPLMVVVAVVIRNKTWNDGNRRQNYVHIIIKWNETMLKGNKDEHKRKILRKIMTFGLLEQMSNVFSLSLNLQCFCCLASLNIFGCWSHVGFIVSLNRAYHVIHEIQNTWKDTRQRSKPKRHTKQQVNWLEKQL